MSAMHSHTPQLQTQREMRIMKGSFDEFSIEEVIQVINLSRQCLRLLVHRHQTCVCEVIAKSGQVLKARAVGQSDAAASFAWLIQSARKGAGMYFEIYHLEHTSSFPRPIASLSELYHLAKNPGRGSDTQRSTRQPSMPEEEAPHDAVASTMSANTDARQVTKSLRQLETKLRAVAESVQRQPTQKEIKKHFERLQAELMNITTREGQSTALIASIDGQLRSQPQLISSQIRALSADQTSSVRSIDGRLSDQTSSLHAVDERLSEQTSSIRSVDERLTRVTTQTQKMALTPVLLVCVIFLQVLITSLLVVSIAVGS